jgi:lipopolysaccharide transport system ATP-binding protein
VGSLLEVGTGFHPELTGRENTYLSGAVLGMRKAEIDRRFDEIVAFSGVEKFIDTPIKRYSSGMNVRLGFAVAAHLEPEILLVDEVLAVGDAAFQKKCLGKMGNVAAGGRTVFLVSHNMAAVAGLCELVLLLESGRLGFIGHANEGIARYLSTSCQGSGERVWADSSDTSEETSLHFTAVRILDSEGNVTSEIDSRKDFFIEIGYTVLQELNSARIGYQLLTASGVVVFASSDQDSVDLALDRRKPGRYVSVCRIPGLLLNEGDYSLSLLAHIPGIRLLTREDQAIPFHVTHLSSVGPSPSRRGIIRPFLEWHIHDLSTSARPGYES